MKIVGIIPSRYASTRFPGKPLTDIAGKSMIQRVYEQCKKATKLEEVVVATDDERIFNHVLEFGGTPVMTGTHHPSGTDRCFEALNKLDDYYDYVINIQGDEPFIQPTQIDLLAGLLDRKVELATLILKVKENKLLFSQNEVKVVFNSNMEAVYFSRSVIPHLRGVEEGEWHIRHDFYRHVGMYAYRADILKALTNLSLSSLEKAESLEQLRWLENGYKIQLAITDQPALSVDTPEDVEAVLKMVEYSKQHK